MVLRRGMPLDRREVKLEITSGTKADWVEMAVKLSWASNSPGWRILPELVPKLSFERPPPCGVKVPNFSSDARLLKERLVRPFSGTNRVEVRLVTAVVLVEVI